MSTSPIISLFENHPRKQQLERKLQEYYGRSNSTTSPESQMANICKIAVLEKLLNDNRVATFDLSLELAETYGDQFDIQAFETACNVIIDYCDTGGQNVWGGTGLE